MTIQWAGAPVDDYELWLECGTRSPELQAISHDGVDRTTRHYFPAVSAYTPQACRLEIQDSQWTAYDAVDFTVAAKPRPALVLSGYAATPSPFYPIVRDGYRDTTSVKYHLSRSASVTVAVRNSSWTTVRTTRLGTLGAGYHRYSWNGRSASGTQVKAGTYSIKVTARDTSGNTRSYVTSARVATTWVTRTGSKSLSGSSGSRAVSGSCYADPDYYDHTMELDCWGGNYAQATYGFSLPSSRYNVSWRASGYYPLLDFYGQGTVTKSASWATPTQLRVRVRVTDWRAYVVERVSVSYSYKKRI